MKDDRVYLLHVRDAIERILTYTAEGREAFFADTKTQDAVIRNLQIIGEAVKRVSDATRDAHAEIPWKRIAGMRDKLIHDYFGVDHELVWVVVENELASLLARVRGILDASSD